MGDKRALITLTGQDGSYLAELLLRRDTRSAAQCAAPASEVRRIEHLRERICLRRPTSSTNCLSSRCQSFVLEIYNLAAQSFVPTSWTQPMLTAEFDAVGVTRMLEAVRLVDPTIRFYQASRRDVRQVRRHPNARPRRFTSKPLRGGQWPLHHGQLPRKLRHLRRRESSSTTVVRRT